VDPRRELPSVEHVLRDLDAAVPHAVRARIARESIDAARTGRIQPGEVIVDAQARVGAFSARLLGPLVNATGVLLHTNLGRAPLGEDARRAVADVAAGYCSLEYDLEAGRRGERGTGIERWLTRLTGAEAAAVVNNGAAAVLVALSAVASGRRVVVSRGELVEIGGSFRVPEILERSGARLVEVGTTNRTHLADYERAFDQHKDIGAILRVHRSNFRLEGFTTSPDPRALAALAHKRRAVMVEDLGSGALVDLAAFGLDHEPTVAESLATGCDLVTFSGDKLLGGAQAGFVLGARRWVARVKKDPFARVARVDKLALAAIEATLPLYADPARAAERIPALAALKADARTLGERAQRLADEITARVPGMTARIVEGYGEVGGGALPQQKLYGPVVELEHAQRSAAEIERLVRLGSPPVLGTVRSDRFRLDPRTLAETELGSVALALAAALK
jgi:L-seryl-tRNA(Ser) seleniumtransferase